MMDIKKSHKLTRQKWLNLFDIEYRDKNGRKKSWQMASRHNEPKCLTENFSIPDAVVIAPYHVDQKRIVLTREYRVPLGDYEYGFPAGLIDDGESIEEAARRELKEETGLEVIRIIKSSQPVYSSAGMTDESVAMVYVECTGRPSNEANTDSEEIEIILASRTQVAALIKNTDIKFDAKAWLVLSSFAESGRL
jgi:ADP-ribose pyrophosphatase